MSMTNQQAFVLYHTLGKYKDDHQLSTKFSWAVMRNRRKLQAFIDSLTDLRKPPVGLERFEAKRIELCNSLADKDESGNPVIKDSSFVISDANKQELNTKLEELRNGEFKAMFDEQERKRKEVEDIMKEPCDIEVYKVNPDYLPEKMSPAELEIIELIIQE